MQVRLFLTAVKLVASLALLLTLVPGGLMPTAAQPRLASPTAPSPVLDRTQVETARPSTPMFIENVGQFDSSARFQVRGGDRTIWLAEDTLWITLFGRKNEQDLASSPTLRNPSVSGYVGASAPVSHLGTGVHIKVGFAGANPHPSLEPFNRLDTHVSYFIGDDAANWHTDVPVWGGVRYVDLYPGVDLEITGEGGRLTQYLVAHPGADLSGVRLLVEGADALTLDGDRLRITTALGDFALPLLTLKGAPPADQPTTVRTERETFEVSFPFAADPLSPSHSAYTANSSDLLYSTFLGGNEEDYGYGIVVDETGSAYVTGSTYSSNFPATAGAFDAAHNGSWDAFVIKVNTNGSGLVYATFLGGSEKDYGLGIAVDGAGNAYVVGWTQSTDFPIIGGAFDTSFGGGTCNIEHVKDRPCPDGFAVKLTSTGTGLAYATFLGGGDYDYGNAIIVDGNGAAYIIGRTHSDDFPTTSGAFDTDYNGSSEWPRFGYWYGDAFVVKLNPGGSGLEYSTYLGGSSFEARFSGIALLPNGEVVVVGITGSSDFPTTAGSFDTTHNGGADVYVTRLNATGSALVYSTFIGASGDEQGNAVVVNDAGAAYVAGWTCSSDFPSTGGAFDSTYNGGCDGFIIKVNPAGNGLTYATFLGGNDSDWNSSLALGQEDTVYVTGATGSSDFPTTSWAFDTSHGGGTCGTDPDTYPCYDAHVVKLDTAGSELAYATFLGGNDEDEGKHIAVDEAGRVYVAGETYSADFPTTAGAFDNVYNGNRDAFVTKLVPSNPTPTITGLDPAWTMVSGGAFVLTVNGTDFIKDSVLRWNGSERATTFVSSSQLKAQITAADISTAGTVNITVFTPSPGGGTSNTWLFSIHNPRPTVTSISPAWTAAGGEALALTVNGTNFIADSTVLWNGSERTTTFVSSSQLRAEITAADIAVAGSADIAVLNPPPGGGTSNAQVFTIADPYEPDDTCAQARSITTDGVEQVHTFHTQGDVDWVTFDAISGTTYVIEAQVPLGSPADLILELYDHCDALPLESQGYTFAPGVRLDFHAAASGPLYLKWLNDPPSVYGDDVAYHLSVRALEDTYTPGALVLVAGRLRAGDSLQNNIHHVTDAVRQLFLSHGYDDDRIYYLATDTGLPGWDALPSAANLQAAITTWAQDKVGPNRAFTLYMMDHGDYDTFYLDNPNGETASPQQVDSWLTQLEAAAPGVKVNVIVEACHSGSFIDRPQQVGGEGRVVIASTGATNPAWASTQGAIFSDHFVAALDRGESLYVAFQTARWATQAVRSAQTPWIEGDGDGVANEVEDSWEAAQRGFAYVGTLGAEPWPPYIVQATGPESVEQGRGVIQAEVRDDEAVKRVWAVIYPPSYQPPAPGEELQQENLPTIVLSSQGNDLYGATYTGFDEMGVYRVVVYAEDDEGLEARPLALDVRTGWQIYLPLVVR